MKTRSSRLPYLVAIVVLLLIVTVAWASRGRFAPVGPGAVAPGFEVADLEGHLVSLEEYQGQVILVNIWATWCPPCREEMPSLERLYQAFRDRGFEVLAVSVDARLGEVDETGNRGGDISAFADSLGLSFRILHDPSGRIQDTYQTTGVPESFLVGRDGTIYRKVAGATIWDSPRYHELVDRLLES